MKNIETKFEEIVTSYINGNISWVKEQVKKLSKDNRKNLYNYVSDNYARTDKVDTFFFNLI